MRAGKRRERMRDGTKLAPQPHDAIEARNRPVQVARSIVEVEALPAVELAQVDVPTAPAAPRALKPRPTTARHRLVPSQPQADAIDQKIGRAGGKLVRKASEQVSEDLATPKYLAQSVKSEIAKWAGPIKASGVSID